MYNILKENMYPVFLIVKQRFSPKKKQLQTNKLYSRIVFTIPYFFPSWQKQTFCLKAFWTKNSSVLRCQEINAVFDERPEGDLKRTHR